MNPLQTGIEKQKSCIATAEAFAAKFGDKLPEGVAHIDFVMMGSATCYLRVGYTESDRQRALALFGDVFGREGWTQALNYDRQSYDWSREIDGVKLFISKAETIPAEPSREVPPTKFPLQLKDAQ